MSLPQRLHPSLFAIAIVFASSITRAAEQPVSGNVLVWEDSKLYVEPSDNADYIQLGRLADGRTAGSVGLVVAMQVVGTTDSFVEVVPLAARNCTSATLLAEIDQPHLFVRRTDLAPVVTRRWSSRFADGSQVTIERGTPVIPLEGGKAALRAGRFRFDLAVPATSIGSAYAAAKPVVDPTWQRGWVLEAKALHVADTTLEGDAFPLVSSTAVHPTKGQTRLALRHRCVTLEVTVPDQSVAPWPALDPNGIIGGLMAIHDELPQGTVLATPSGRSVGKVRFSIAATRTKDGKLACGQVPFSAANDPGAPDMVKDPSHGELTLCAPASKLRHNGGWTGVGSTGGAETKSDDPMGDLVRVVDVDLKPVTRLTGGEVRATLSAYKYDLETCVQRDRAGHASSAKRVELALDIDEIGAAAVASAKGEDAQLGNCVVSLAANRWQFRVPEDTMTSKPVRVHAKLVLELGAPSDPVGHGSSSSDTGGPPTPAPRAAKSVPTISFGQPTSGPGLDAAIIRRYLKRSIKDIESCYQNSCARLLASKAP
jgi:hypothetical protein